MKKIFRILLPLLVVLLICPSIGNTRVNTNEELTSLINVIELHDAGDDIGLTDYIQYQTSNCHVSTPIELARGGGRSGGFSSGRSSGGWGSSRSSGSSSRGSSSSGGSKSNTTKPKSSWGNKSNNNISGSRNNNTNTNKNTTTVKNKNTTTNKNASKTGKNTTATKPTKRKLSTADKKLAEKAKKEGKYHKDRNSAREAFKKQNAAKYTSKYTTQPATRPAHIPQTTLVGGVSYNVSYNTGFGGYGYYGPGGAWMMYDMMTDLVMMDMMMNRTGYVVASDLGTPVPIRAPGYYFLNLLYFIIIIVVIIAVMSAIKHSRNDSDV